MSALLSRERYKEIIGPAVAGDPRAVEEMVRAYRPLVLSIVRPFVARNGADLEDLVQEGNLGLLFALRKFDPDRGVPFHIYAGMWIKSRAQSWTRRITIGKFTARTDRVLLTRSFVVRRELEQRFGRPASHREIAEALNVSVEAVDDYYAKSIPSAQVVDDLEREDGFNHGHVVTARGLSAEKAVELRETLGKIREVFDALDERSREMLSRRMEGESLEEVAVDYGISRERVRQIVNVALRRIRARVPAPMLS